METVNDQPRYSEKLNDLFRLYFRKSLKFGAIKCLKFSRYTCETEIGKARHDAVLELINKNINWK